MTNIQTGHPRRRHHRSYRHCPCQDGSGPRHQDGRLHQLHHKDLPDLHGCRPHVQLKLLLKQKIQIQLSKTQCTLITNIFHVWYTNLALTDLNLRFNCCKKYTMHNNGMSFGM